MEWQLGEAAADQRRQPRRGLSLPGAPLRVRAARAFGQNHPDLPLLLLLILAALVPRVYLQLNAPTFVFGDSPGDVEPAVNQLTVTLARLRH